MYNNYIFTNKIDTRIVENVMQLELELSNNSFYDNTIAVDEFDCPWVVIIADK